ncbi:MAG: ABC transporter substrate-binding protein [Candidatus Kapabacteria bacterium]|nr:ABC transporter substrate-binding protein [Candidatus Kapabacteria bacterium]
MNKIYKILIFVALFFMFSCGKEEAVAPEQKIIIAAILDTTGHYSQFGKEVIRGMELYTRKYATSYELRFYDSKGDADVALAEFIKIASNTYTRGVVTLASWISNAIAEPAKNNRVVQFAVGSAVYNFANLKNCVRFTSDVNDEIKYLSNYLNDYNRIVIMHFDNDYGVTWNNNLKGNLGGKIIRSFSYPDTMTQFTSILEEVKALNPSRLVLISTREAVHIVRQAKAIGLNVQIVGTRPILTEQLLATSEANGLIFSYPNLDEHSPAYQDYLSRYGKKPSSFVAEGYDLCFGLDNAIRTNGTAPADIWDWFDHNGFYGMLGRIKFDSLAQASYDYNLNIIKDGDYVIFP